MAESDNDEPTDGPTGPATDGGPGDRPASEADRYAQAMAGPDWTERPRRSSSDAGTPPRKRRNKLRRRILIGTGLLVLLVAVAAGWVLYSGFKARSELEAARAAVHTLRSDITAGDLTGALTAAKSVETHADRAHDYTTGPLWATAAALPYLGDPLDTVRAVTSNVALVADHALPQLVEASQDLQPDHLRQADGSFALGPIERLGPELQNASAVMRTALAGLRKADASTWLDVVDTARGQVIDQLAPLTGTVDSLGKAVRVVPPLLGADGPKTYMISFQNDAEIRGTGGIPGAFAILKADDGKLTFSAFEPDDYLVGASAGSLSFGQQFAQVYQGALHDYRDSNESVHFPYAAQIWSAMWQQKGGQPLDGAIVIDPTALSHLLEVTGPVTLADGSQVTSSNVVALTQKTLYERFPAAAQNDARKKFLLDLAEAVSKHLLDPEVDITGLVKAAGRAADEYRLQMWSREPDVEKELATVPLGGVLPQDNRPYSTVSIVSESQSKLDYYLHASLDWTRQGCGPTRDVTLTVKLADDAPAGLPPYVLGNSSPPGAEFFYLTAYGSIGGRFGRTTVDGHRPIATIPGSDQKHPVQLAWVPVPRGKTVTVVFHLTEPAGQGDVLVRPQPMINPMTVTVHDQPCGR